MSNPFDSLGDPSPEVAYVGDLVSRSWQQAVFKVLGEDSELAGRIAALAGFNMLAELSNDMRALLTNTNPGGSLDDLNADDIAKLFEEDFKKKEE